MTGDTWKLCGTVRKHIHCCIILFVFIAIINYKTSFLVLAKNSIQWYSYKDFRRPMIQNNSYKKPLKNVKSNSSKSYDSINQKANNFTPIQKIGYLKTHKCASTSVQNILLRYAIRNNLKVVLPPKGGNILGYENIFNRNLLKSSFWEKALGYEISYDMFLCHARWNKNEVSYVLNDTGKNDVFYFTFLRDPVDLFISYWDYNAFGVEFGPLKEFLSEKVALQLKNKTEYIWNKQYQYNCGGYNIMLYDFGLECKDMTDAKKVEKKIKEIGASFDLILLSDEEYFDDSIILLKHSINWNNEDMINFKLNTISPLDKTYLPDAERNLLKEWLWADYQLYNHFKRIYFNKVKRYGRAKLESEKEILKNETHWAWIYCQSNTPKESCKYYKATEGYLLNIVRSRQKAERLNKLQSLGHFNQFRSSRAKKYKKEKS